MGEHFLDQGLRQVLKRGLGNCLFHFTPLHQIASKNKREAPPSSRRVSICTSQLLGDNQEMVNTMVKDPENRKINRKLDRQKKARMKQNKKALLNPLDSDAAALAEIHTLRASELKKEREKLKNQGQIVSDFGDQKVVEK